MKRLSKLFVALTIASLILGFSIADQTSAAYPEKMITYIVPFKAGGGTDRTARILSTGAIDHFGQAWHVRNMPGASAIVGWKELLRRPVDGYTIMQSSSTPVIALLLEEPPPLSPFDIKIACYVAGFRSIIVSKPGAEWSSWEKFKAAAKKDPGKITLAGTQSLLMGAAAMFDQAGIKVNFVPYESTGAAVADFLGGHVNCLAATSSTLLPLIPEKATPIVNTSDVPLPEKLKEFKDVPDAKSLGYEGMFFPRWVGVHPDTPDEIVDIISEKMSKLVKDKSVKKLFSKIGEEIIFLPRSEAEVAYKQMVESMKKAIKLLK
ncbi:MAG: tripartite tricarboxylate transporter substrate binding protein [Deltaproteobacteria bacterium]|nr:tripartite tricarboxylate transporter substrate binding protein [Deltaproteobacteria bacterium]